MSNDPRPESQIFARKPLALLLEEAKGENRLRRVLGPVQLTTLGVGAIIGAGIFVATGAAAHNIAGPALMLSYVVAGITCIFAALCYAEFASMVPVAGSAYTYAYATLGELFAWIIGWDLVLEYACVQRHRGHGWSAYFQSVRQQHRHPHSQAGERVPLELRPRHRPLRRPPAPSSTCPRSSSSRSSPPSSSRASRRAPRSTRPWWRSRSPRCCSSSASAPSSSTPTNWHPFAPFGWTGISFFGHHVAGQTDARRRADRHAGRRGDHLLRLHRLRLGLHPRRGGQEPAARRAHRHHRLADHLHRPLHRRRGRAHRHGPVRPARHQRPGRPTPSSQNGHALGRGHHRHRRRGRHHLRAAGHDAQPAPACSWPWPATACVPKAFFGDVHPKFRTPWKSTMLIGCLRGHPGRLPAHRRPAAPDQHRHAAGLRHRLRRRADHAQEAPRRRAPLPLPLGALRARSWASSAA